MSVCDVEDWKDVPGFEGIYRASDRGNILSIDRFEVVDGFRRRRCGRMLKPRVSSTGDLLVTFTANSERHYFSVRRVVAMTFLSEYKSSFSVIHDDGNKENCRADNLKMVPKSDPGRIGASVCGDRRKPEQCSDLPGEQWRSMPGFQLYQISDLGRVRTIARELRGTHGCVRRIPSRVVSQRQHAGRVSVRIFRDGKSVAVSVPRMMGIVFHGFDFESRAIGRVDGDAANCVLSNLEFPEMSR